MNWQPWPYDFDARVTRINSWWENRLFDVVSGYAELRNPWAWMLVTCSGVCALFLTTFLFLSQWSFPVSTPDSTAKLNLEDDSSEITVALQDETQNRTPQTFSDSTFAWNSPESDDKPVVIDLGPAVTPDKPKPEATFTHWAEEPDVPKQVPDPFEFPVAAEIPPRRPQLDVIIQRTDLLPDFRHTEQAVAFEGLSQPTVEPNSGFVQAIASTGWSSAAGTLFEEPFVRLPSKQEFSAFQGPLNELATSGLFSKTETETSRLTVTRTVPKQFTEGQVQRYELEILNSGTTPFVDLRLIEAIPAGMEVVFANPVPKQHDNHLVWDILEIDPGQTQTIEVDVIASHASLALFQTTAFRQLTAVRDVNVVPLLASLDGPEQIDFEVETFERVILTVVNRGEMTISNPYLVIDIPSHLHHKVGPKLTRPIKALSPGESRQISVTFAGIEAGHGSIQVQLVDHKQVLASRQIQAATRLKSTVRKQLIPRDHNQPEMMARYDLLAE